MILLVTTSSRGKEIAAALEHSDRQKVQLANSVNRALALLQTTDFEALLVDESLVEIDDRAIDALLNHAGLAMPIYINLGLHRTERVVREVHAGLMRKHAEHISARQSAERLLRSELRGDVTGILLASELVLRDSAISPRVADRVQSVHKLAEQIRTRLHLADAS